MFARVLARSWSPYLIVGLLAIACDRTRDEEKSASTGMPAQQTEAPTAVSFAAVARTTSAVRPEIDLASARMVPAPLNADHLRFAQRSQPPQAPSTTQPRVTGMIIRNGDVAVQVDSVEQAIAAVRQLATSLGGYIGNVSTATGEYQVRSASLEMKIPAQRFDEAMAGMRPLGKVERSAATAEDVGEEFVDISARVANAKRLETRLVDLLARRTGKLEDVLRVERELARVREEIERYEGRIRFLSSRVATSTIVVTVHEKAPIIAAHPGTNVMSQAFVNMWRNFVRVIAAGIESLGVVVPALVLAWVALTLWGRWRRRSIAAPVAALP